MLEEKNTESIARDASKVVVNYSGGICSFLAAKRAAERFGAHNITLLFADTREEDADLYRFLREGADYLNASLVEVHSPYTMDELIDKENAIPSSRMGFCTRQLKQKPADAWIKANAPDALRVFGIDWTETHRMEGLIRRFGESNVWCPMTESPYLMKAQMLDVVRELGIKIPRLYAEGFQHNNCGGGCVKAGQSSWAHLLRMRPDTYAIWEAREARISDRRGFTCAVLRDRANGADRPLSLKEFRERVNRNDFDTFDFGGCGCFLEVG